MPSQNNLHIISSVESASFAIATSHWNQQFYLSAPTRIWNSKSVLANILLLLFVKKWYDYPLSRDTTYSNFKECNGFAPYSAVFLQVFPQSWNHVSTVKERWEMNPWTHSYKLSCTCEENVFGLQLLRAVGASLLQNHLTWMDSQPLQSRLFVFFLWIQLKWFNYNN